MTTTLIGLFGGTDEARKAARAIAGTGHAKQEPQVMGAGATGGDVGEELSRRGFDRDTARRYAEAVAKGPVLVLARVEDERADDVAEVIDAQGALSLEEAERRGDAKQVTLDVVQEEAEIRKQGVAQGAVRVSRHVTEKPFRETVTLEEKHVEVDRREVERQLGTKEAEAAFEEKTEEFVESAERAVVEKRAKVVGEVTVSQTVETHRETVEGTLRRADVEVERLQAAKDERKAQR